MSITKHRRIFFLLLGIILLAGNVAVYQLAKNKVYDFVGQRVRAAATDMSNRVNSRVSIYSTILFDSAAFISTKNTLTAEDWNNYVTRSQVFERYPGLDILSYSPVIFSSQEDSLKQEANRRGVPNYQVYPSKSTLVEAPILFAASKNEDVRPLIGFNLFSEPERKAALEYATSNNSIAITNIIIPIVDRDKSDPRKAIVAIMPIYRTGADLSTPEKRQANIIGFVDAGFQPQVMMKNLSLSALPGIQFQAFDNSQNGVFTSANMLYNSGGDDLIQPGKTYLFTTIEEVQWPNTKWYLRFVAVPDDFLGKLLWFLPYMALVLSLILTVLLLIGVRQLLGIFYELKLTASVRADRLIAEDAVVDAYQDGIIATDPHGLIMIFNKKAEQVLGYIEDQVIKQKSFVSLVTTECLQKHAKRVAQEMNAAIHQTFDCLVTKSLIDGQDQLDLEFLTRAGQKLVISVKVRPLYDLTNFLLGYQFIFNDGRKL